MSKEYPSLSELDWMDRVCPFCMQSLGHGAKDDGRCGHEELLENYPHLRFNAADYLTKEQWADSVARFKQDHNKGHEWP